LGADWVETAQGACADWLSVKTWILTALGGGV